MKEKSNIHGSKKNYTPPFRVNTKSSFRQSSEDEERDELCRWLKLTE